MSTERGVAVVGGLGPGLGAALVTLLAQNGYSIATLSRRGGAAGLKALPAGVDRDRIRHYACDMTDEPCVRSVAARIEAELGPITVFVYNAAHLVVAPFLETSAADFETSWRSIVFGATNCARAILPSMLDRGAGTIVLTGATASIRGGARFSAFASAKFALRGLAQSLAREFGPRGIHVAHAVIDGMIWDPNRESAQLVNQKDCLLPEAIASEYLHIIEQPRSAWTHELDLRPDGEKF